MFSRSMRYNHDIDLATHARTIRIHWHHRYEWQSLNVLRVSNVARLLRKYGSSRVPLLPVGTHAVSLDWY